MYKHEPAGVFLRYFFQYCLKTCHFVCFYNTATSLSYYNELTWLPGVTTVLNCTMYSYQNCTTLDRKYEFKTNFSKKSSWYLFKQHFNCNLVAKITCASGNALCLRWSYLCAWKSSPSLFTPSGNKHQQFKWTRIVTNLG